MCTEYMAQDYLETVISDPPNGHLNYIDLDLVPPLEVGGSTPRASMHHPTATPE